MHITSDANCTLCFVIVREITLSGQNPFMLITSDADPALKMAVCPKNYPKPKYSLVM